MRRGNQCALAQLGRAEMAFLGNKNSLVVLPYVDSKKSIVDRFKALSSEC